MIPFHREDRVSEAVATMLPGCRALSVRRMAKGQSTIVYRIDADDRTLYLRIWPEPEESFGPEVLVHRLLHRYGAHVPEVLQWAGGHPALDRSFMLTSSVAGQSLDDGVPDGGIEDILRAAGRNLAAVNKVPVRGFGFIRRHPDSAEDLEGEYPDFNGWMRGHYGEPLSLLLQSDVFAAGERAAIAAAAESSMRDLRCPTAFLAHGDFDTSHIYHRENKLSGLIDFGEIRGAHREYDLGHFWVDGEAFLPAVLEGYRSISSLPADAMRRIVQSGLLVACRRIGRCLARSKAPYGFDMQAVRRAIGILA
jgi:aminoglycoside phosphotransferase (APT) family kinase protein